MLDISTLLTSLLSGLITAAISGIGVFFTMKQKIAIIETKLDALEKKQDKHNNLIERMTRVEVRLDDMCSDK